MPDLSALIRSALSHTLDQKGADYFARPAGSTLVGVDSMNGDSIVALLGTLEWTDVTDEASACGARMGECSYFRARLPAGVSGLEGIMLLGELTDDQIGEVRLRRGHHGNIEHFIPGLEAVETDVVHVIVCNRNTPAWPPTGEVTVETAMAVTWYPGRLTPGINTPGITVKRG